MTQVIVPDLNATEDLDVARLQIEDGVAVASALLAVAKTDAERETREQDLADAEALLEAYQPGDDMPVIVIGYIPAPKRAYLVNAAAEASRSAVDGKPLTTAQMNAITDASREWLQWGVKGHRNLSGYPWNTKPASAGGREYKIAADDVVELYEQMELLHSLSDAVAKFNILDAKKKMKSPSTSTEETETSTVPDVETTRT